ncbi:MAG: hypothetical protein ACLS3C_15470 [Oscillospiraceae bacterium]
MKTPPVIESGCGRFRLEAFADGQEQARLDGMFETVLRGIPAALSAVSGLCAGFG